MLGYSNKSSGGFIKILCPFHKEDTGSLHLYDDSFYCFGCGASGVINNEFLTKLGIKRLVQKKNEPENIAESIRRIVGLPKKLIRGLELHYDESGYYLLWGNYPYYAKRYFNRANSNKYYYPKGIKKPLFCRGPGSGIIKYRPGESILISFPNIVVEGQINCESGYRGYPNAIWLSPGGVTDLIKPDFINSLLHIPKIYVIVDKDAVGVAAAIEIKEQRQPKGLKTVIYAMPKDLNDILVESGPDAVRKEIEKALEMP